jgi:hypothetical protein
VRGSRGKRSFVVNKSRENEDNELFFSTIAMKTFKSNLAGLNSFCRLVMYEVFSYCDYKTGFALLPSLHELAQTDFQVEAALGRKQEIINELNLR